jgi:hypothetical protein
MWICSLIYRGALTAIEISVACVGKIIGCCGGTLMLPEAGTRKHGAGYGNDGFLPVHKVERFD